MGEMTSTVSKGPMADYFELVVIHIQTAKSNDDDDTMI